MLRYGEIVNHERRADVEAEAQADHPDRHITGEGQAPPQGPRNPPHDGDDLQYNVEGDARCARYQEFEKRRGISSQGTQQLLGIIGRSEDTVGDRIRKENHQRDSEQPVNQGETLFHQKLLHQIGECLFPSLRPIRVFPRQPVVLMCRGGSAGR